MRCIRTLASLVDFYGPYLKTIWPPTRASKGVFLSTPKIYLYTASAYSNSGSLVGLSQIHSVLLSETVISSRRAFSRSRRAFSARAYASKALVTLASCAAVHVQQLHAGEMGRFHFFENMRSSSRDLAVF